MCLSPHPCSLFEFGICGWLGTFVNCYNYLCLKLVWQKVLQWCVAPDILVHVLNRWCAAYAHRSHVLVAALQSQCRLDHPAVLSAFPLHQYVAVQQTGDWPRFRPVFPLLGRNYPPAAGAYWSLGREAGTRVGSWLSLEQDRAGVYSFCTPSSLLLPLPCQYILW